MILGLSLLPTNEARAVEQVAKVDFNGDGTFDQIYIDMESAWEEALGEGNTENTVICLQADWIAGSDPAKGFNTDNVTSNVSVEGKGFISIKDNKSRTLDLNGHKLIVIFPLQRMEDARLRLNTEAS